MRKLFLILVVLCCASWASAAPVLVQQVACAVTTGTPGGKVCSFGSNITAGNSVIITLGKNGSAGMVSVTGGGVTFTRALQTVGPSNNCEIWYGHVSSGGVTDVTFAAANFSRWGAVLLEVSGLANSAPEATNGSSASADASPVTGSVAPASAASIVVAVMGAAPGGGGYVSGPTNSFTRTNVPTAASNVFAEGAYQIETASAAYSTGWTIGADNWSTAIAVFGGAASGPTPSQRSAGFFMPPK